MLSQTAATSSSVIVNADGSHSAFGATRVAAGPLHRTALVLQRPESTGEAVVVGEHDPTLSGGDALVRRERQATGDADRAERTPVDARDERLGGVLDDGDAVLSRDLQDGR